MQLIKPDVNVDFIGKRKIAFALSIVFILVGIVSLIAKGGPSYGVDFAGGTLVQLRFAENTSAEQIKKILIPNVLSSATVQQFGDQANEYLVRAKDTDVHGLRTKILQALGGHYGDNKVDLRRIEMVGPQVGKELRQQGLLAVLYAMIGILVYVTWRFELIYALGAIVALLHDVLLTLGAFSLFGKEIDLPVIAAFLAIVGYSLNDTIIVYDRIRENTGKYISKGFPFTVNRSINETLSRTILTSSTTLLVVLALFIFGGGVIHNFAFALLVGVVVGTYSSIFVASPLLISWDERKRNKAKK
ncbi:MAG: protein translocase subunit SecF [Desulfobacteraceae bacterium 4572_35.1]|nr:MAG: protein translocase subunit SecF [Desulfobacteraceae bacterium 4572_35.1]